MKEEKTVLVSEETAITQLAQLYSRYGYSQYRMRKFEEYDLYVRNKSFLLSDRMITFTEPSGKLMALRPDVTLSIAKNTKDAQAALQKLYYKENVYREDRDSGSFREIMQVGLECQGQIDVYTIYEVLRLALLSLRALGSDFVLDISHLGLLSAVLEAAGLPEQQRPAVLRCIGEKNAHGAAALCAQAGLSAEGIAMVNTLITTYGQPDAVLAVFSAMPLSAAGQACLADLRAVLSPLAEEGLCANVRLDFSVIHDMKYYNGIVFRGFLSGVPSGILSGGQYDYLMQRMGRSSGAIGFAVYPDLLAGLYAPRGEYDVDTVLLYTEQAAPARIAQAVQALGADGQSVLAQQTLPPKLHYRRLCRLTESGVIEE